MTLHRDLLEGTISMLSRKSPKRHILRHKCSLDAYDFHQVHREIEETTLHHSSNSPPPNKQ